MSRIRLISQVLLLVLAAFLLAVACLEALQLRPGIRAGHARFEDQLHREATQLSAYLERSWNSASPQQLLEDYLAARPGRDWRHPGRDWRHTVFDSEGQALADSQEDLALMERLGGADSLRVEEVLEVYGPGPDGQLAVAVDRIVVAGTPVGYGRVSAAQAGLLAAESELRWRGWRALALSFLAVAVGAAWWALRIVRPLRRLDDVVSAAARGEIDERLALRGSRELAELGRSANEMLDALRERLSGMRREQLEKDAILAGMSEGVVAVDQDQRVVLANAAAREMLGAIDRDPRGQPIWEVTRVPEVVQTVAACILENRHLRTEARVAGDDPHMLELGAAPLSMGSAVRDEGGEAARGCVLVLRDVSGLRHLEQVRRDFVANVSHELKTPLTAMRGFLETVLEYPDMPAAVRTDFLHKAERNTARLAAIVTDLMTLARAEADDGQPDMKSVDLVLVARGCVADVVQASSSRQVRVELDLPGSELVVHADQGMIATAIRNLLENADKYSPRESPILVRIGSDGSDAWLEVQDQGPGIPPTEQERIFERFYRIDKDRSRQLGGTGLGLSIVRNLLVAHGGDVSVESQPGQGSRFRIRFPISGTD